MEDYKSKTTIEVSKKKISSILDLDNTPSSSVHLRLQEYRLPESKKVTLTPEKKLDDTSISEMHPQKRRKITIVPNKVKFESETGQSPKKANEKAVSIVQKIAKNMSADKIQLFHTSILAYKKDCEIFNLIKGLHELLVDETKSEEYLSDIIAFVKPKDKQIFESYTQLRSKWDSLSVEERINKHYSDFLLTKI